MHFLGSSIVASLYLARYKSTFLILVISLPLQPAATYIPEHRVLAAAVINGGLTDSDIHNHNVAKAGEALSL